MLRKLILTTITVMLNELLEPEVKESIPKTQKTCKSVSNPHSKEKK